MDICATAIFASKSRMQLERRATQTICLEGKELKGPRMTKLKMAAAGLAVMLSACTSTGTSGPGADLQAFADGGDRPVATAIIDAMAGGLIGGALGARLDQRDRRKALEAEYRALEYMPAGQAVSWGGRRRNGEVVAGSPYRVGSQDCRQYIHTVNIGGQSRSARSAACRNADGSWTPLV